MELIFASIWPSELILRIIIIMMMGVAIYIAYRFSKLSKLVSENLIVLENIRDVTPLTEALIKNNFTKQSADKLFAKFAEERGIKEENKYIFEHLNSIYLAGFRSSHLEPELLVENTLANIFRRLEGLRSFISVFLVIGILGTLFGLAGSIGSFSGGNFDIASNSSQINEISTQISTLFKQLRGAFAPSIWGVIFTIIFVIWYSVGIQEGLINRLTERLMHYTIKEWVPVLYPTDFQRGENTMIKLNNTINNAEAINKGVRTLQEDLSIASSSVNAT